MSFLEILKIVAALATAATGIFVLFAPRKTVGFTASSRSEGAALASCEPSWAGCSSPSV